MNINRLVSFGAAIVISAIQWLTVLAASVDMRF